MDVSGKVIKRVRKMAGSVAGSAGDVAGSAVEYGRVGGGRGGICGRYRDQCWQEGSAAIRTHEAHRAPSAPGAKAAAGTTQNDEQRVVSYQARAGYACDSYEERTSQEGHEREGALGEAFQALQDGPLRSPDRPCRGCRERLTITHSVTTDALPPFSVARTTPRDETNTFPG